MGRVPREEFVPTEYREAAYEDRPLPIGLEQTISQPYIIALMTEALRSHRRGKGARVGYRQRLPDRHPRRSSPGR